MKLENHFQSLIRSSSLSHAYLFGGPRGIGKQAFMLQIAKWVNCRAEELSTKCDCQSCHKIETGNHPDLHFIGADLDERSIKIETIRKMQSWLSLKAFEGKKKVVLILEAERMNDHAQNALLKTLEEPPENSLILMSAQSNLQFLPTILSRVSSFTLEKQSFQTLTLSLEKEYSLGKAAPFFAYYSKGSQTLVEELLEGDLLEVRKEVISLFLNYQLEKFLDPYLKKTKESPLLKMQLVIDILFTLLRDLFIAKTGSSSQILNQDFEASIMERSQEHSATLLKEGMDQLMRYKRILKSNGNPKIVATQVIAYSKELCFQSRGLAV